MYWNLAITDLEVYDGFSAVEVPQPDVALSALVARRRRGHEVPVGRDHEPRTALVCRHTPYVLHTGVTVVVVPYSTVQAATLTIAHGRIADTTRNSLHDLYAATQRMFSTSSNLTIQYKAVVSLVRIFLSSLPSRRILLLSVAVPTIERRCSREDAFFHA